MQFFHQFGQTESAYADYRSNKRTTLPDDREFLDDHLHLSNELIQTIEASCWLEARHLL
jgi:hypothetical protein